MVLNYDLFTQMLGYMFKGMIGIFGVTAIIILAIVILNKLTNKNDGKNK